MRQIDKREKWKESNNQVCTTMVTQLDTGTATMSNVCQGGSGKKKRTGEWNLCFAAKLF